MRLIPEYLTNLEGIANWKSKLADLNKNKNRILQLNFIGDSITAGVGAAPGNDLNTLANASYVGVIRNRFNSIYQDCGRGFIGPYWHDPTTIQYMTFSDGWVQSGYPQDYSQGIMESWITQTPNSTVSFPFIGTGIRIFYQQGTYTARNNNYTVPGSFTISIDGATVISQNMAGTNDGGHHVDFTGLSNGPHTVVITYTGTSAQAMVFQGIQELRPATYGINTNNLGRLGGAARYFNATGILNNTINSFTPDLTCIVLGVNDYLDEFFISEPGTFTTNMSNLISAVKTNGSDCMVIIEPQPEVGTNYTPPWTTYVNELYTLADENDCAVLDLTKRFAGRSGLFYDWMLVHPNPIGHRDMAQAILSAIS